MTNLLRKKPTFAAALCLMFLSAMFGLSSCNDGNDGPGRTPFMGIGTLVSTSTNSTVFTYYPDTTMRSITLSASVGIQGSVKEGDRIVMVFYAPGDSMPKRDCEIDLYAVQMVNKSDVSYVNIADSASWGEIPTYVQALWYGGPYLNLTAVVQQEHNNVGFALLVDQESLSTDTAQLYLSNKTQPNYAAPSRQAFASFNISSLHNRGIGHACVHFVNSANPHVNKLMIKLEN